MEKNYLKNQLSKLLVKRAGITICFLLYLLITTIKIASAQIDPLEFPPGHPNVTVSAIDQLKSFPLPRYKPGHTLLQNFNWIDPIYFGGRFQSGVTDAQAVTNSVEIQTELAKNFNYYVNISWSTDNFNTAWKNLANANPQWPVGMLTFRAQTGTKIFNQSLPSSNYLQNSSGQYLDVNGSVTTNKVWRPTAPVSSYTPDGQQARSWIDAALSGLTRNVDLVNEDGEVFWLYQNSALAADPQVAAAKAASGLDWETFLAQKVKENDQQAYRDQFMSLPQLQNAKFTEYRMDGQREWNFRWEQMRYISTQIKGQYYSTSDFYVRWPSNWKDWSGPWHGLKWMTQSRHFEIAAGDRLFSPFVAAGYDADAEKDVRPAQWLGLLKLLGIYGAEFYYSCYFNEQGNYNPPNPPPYNPRGYAWQAVMPPYSQAVTSRYEDILRGGSLMPGDMTDNSNSTGPIPYYQFNTGASNKIVAIRKKDAANIYAITGTIQNSSNVAGSTPLTGEASITLNGQNLKFNIRRQGSTYIYDNSNTSAPVFYQLDGWHEATHPSYWSKDFNLEAELYDNTNASYSIKTSVPSGTAAGDFRNYTSYISFPDNQTTFTPIEYIFQPRNTSNTNYYVWVLARTRTAGTTTGFSVSVDNANSKSVGCIADNSWTWYRLDACSQQAIQFPSLTPANHTLRIVPVNAQLEIDRIILTSNASMTQTPVGGACSSSVATITANGATTFCQGGSVVLTASSGSSYLWTPGGQTTQSITATAAGSYSVAVGTGSSCSATSTPVTVTIASAPTATITANGPTTFCQGDNVTLTASAGTSYLWSPGNQTTQSITVNSAGSYSVRVTASGGCSATSSPTNVTVTSGISATITPNGATTFCQGGSVTLTASAGASYLWSPGNQTTQSITVSSAGNYSVRVTSAGGCSATSAATTVNINSNPSAVISPSGSTTFCQGGSVTLTSSAASSYLWSPGNQTTQSIVVSSSGNYTVRTTSASGCSATSSITNVTVNALPTANISAGSATSFCQGGSVTLSASNASSYLWSPGNQTTQSINVAASGSYSVKVTNANGCSATSSAQNVTVNVPVVPVITPSGPTTINQGQSVTLTSSVSSSYLWTPGGQTTRAISVSAAGNYRVTTTDANGCSAISSATSVTVNANIPVTIAVSGSSTICSGDSVLLTASSGYSYLWYPGLETSQSIYAKVGGVYTVNASNGTTAQATIVVSDKPMNPSITTTYIPNAAYQLTAYEPSAISYLWSNGQTTQTISLSSAATVSVRAINNSGCMSNLQSMVVTNPVAQPCAKANMLSAYNIIDVAAGISWNPAIVADSFIVSYSLVGSSAGSSFKVAGNISNAKIEGLTPGGTYQWTVKTFCSGNSQVSAASQFTTLNGPLSCGSTPIDLQTTNITESSAKITWYNTAGQEYQVRYRKVGDANYIYRSMDPSVNPDGGNLKNLLSNTTYEWSVQSLCNGSYSLYAPAKVFTTVSPCASIGSIKEASKTHRSAIISWDPSITADTFKIRFAIQGTTNYKVATIVGNPNPGHGQIENLRSDTYYTVQARTKCANGGRSEWSAPISIHTLPRPVARTSDVDPLQLNAYPNPAHEKITYAFVTDETSEYKVKVTDMSGRQLLQITRNAEEGLNGDALDVSNYANGIYMLIIEQGPSVSRFKFSVN